MLGTRTKGMIPYNKKENLIIESGSISIYSFISKSEQNDNIDWETVESFGDEWTKFNNFSQDEIQLIGDEYFDIVSEEMLTEDMMVLDVGCGTGRWSKYVSTRCKYIEAIDPSHAVLSASKLLSDLNNVRITQAEVGDLPFDDESFDFVFSLGVLHHIPNTAQAMKDAVAKLKSNGYFLVYLYYSLDNRGPGFKSLFLISDWIRNFVYRLPPKMKRIACDVLAVFLYMPFIFLAKLVNLLFPNRTWYRKIPLSSYFNKSFNVIRNDSLDRFGTKLEQRFSQAQIREMMKHAGLDDIVFSKKEPYWHAVGRKE